MNALVRLPDWPARLVAFFEQRARLPFEWGSNDCIIFAADDVLAITGTDPLVHVRNDWHDMASAQAALRSAGGISRAVIGVLGAPLPTPRLAQRGDVVLVHASEPVAGRSRRFLAVCDAGRWAAPHRTGIIRGPMRQAVRAWGVGHA